MLQHKAHNELLICEICERVKALETDSHSEESGSLAAAVMLHYYRRKWFLREKNEVI